ncbi:MAG: hypothetical protein D6718_02975 [Acidobacteria bacterium]|nr:MAG: hypothetical protein D6718_02975 [Acidobacteriota bacterium]
MVVWRFTCRRCGRSFGFSGDDRRRSRSANRPGGPIGAPHRPAAGGPGPRRPPGPPKQPRAQRSGAANPEKGALGSRFPRRARRGTPAGLERNAAGRRATDEGGAALRPLIPLRRKRDQTTVPGGSTARRGTTMTPSRMQ